MELSKIVRFPRARSQRSGRAGLSLLALHFDLACLWLTDRGWNASCPSSGAIERSDVPNLSTDAPQAYLSVALAVAHLDLCEFLVEAHGFSRDQLPDLADLQSTKIMETISDHSGGRVYVHG